jgi:hypothetical protein
MSTLKILPLLIAEIFPPPLFVFLPMSTVLKTRKLEDSPMSMPVTAGAVAEIRIFAFI